MGIRFYCPNGHRLNVKEFLAGKQGICPQCDARFRIPRESEIPIGSPKIKPGSAAETDMSAGKRRPKSASAVNLSPVSPSGELSLATARARPEPRVQPAVDPIEEAPDAVWYVRPPSGGQYGPAKGEVLRKWMAEGRVSADSLVWREGWKDWQLAGPVFPQLQNAFEPLMDIAAPAPLQAAAAAPKLATPTPVIPTNSAARPVGKKKNKSLAAVIVLGLITVALFVGLVTVLIMKN